MIHLINFLLLGAGMAPIDTNPAPDTSGATPDIPSTVPGVSPIDMVPGYEGAFLKMFLALIGLIIAIFVTVWLLKKLSQGKWAGGNSNKAIKIIEKRPLSPKTMLYIIDVDGQQSVIAESQLEVKHLMNLEEYRETESTK